MKFCTKCGAEVADEAVVCTKCGCPIAGAQPAVQTAPRKLTGIEVAAKVFMILRCVFVGMSLIPLCWCIPMTVSASKKMANGEPIGVGFKVCTLLFVSLIGGILLLCRKEPTNA